jgi:hypothetical protein
VHPIRGTAGTARGANTDRSNEMLDDRLRSRMWWAGLELDDAIFGRPVVKAPLPIDPIGGNQSAELGGKRSPTVINRDLKKLGRVTLEALNHDQSNRSFALKNYWEFFSVDVRISF